MDVTKVKSAITAARSEIKKTVEACIEAGKKDGRQFNALRSLANADSALTRAEEKVDDAVKRVAPKAKKEAKAKK